MDITSKITQKPSGWQLAIRIGLGVALVAWVLWNLDWPSLVESFRHIQWAWVAAAVLSFMLSAALKLLRWRWLLSKLAPHTGWLKLARAYFLGQTVNIVGMGRLGEVARVFWLRREGGVSGVGIATSVVAEKLLDLVFMGLAGGWWLLTLFSPPEGVNVANMFLVSGASLLALILFAWWGQSALRWLHGRLAAWDSPLGRWSAPRVAALSEGLAGLTQRRQLGRSLLISAVIWINMLATNLVLLRAFGLPFSGRLAVSVLVLGLLGIATNLMPANIGPYHWAVSLALTLFGVPQATALAYAFVLHAIVNVVPLAIALMLNSWQWPSVRNAESLLTPD